MSFQTLYQRFWRREHIFCWVDAENTLHEHNRRLNLVHDLDKRLNIAIFETLQAKLYLENVEIFTRIYTGDLWAKSGCKGKQSPVHPKDSQFWIVLTRAGTIHFYHDILCITIHWCFSDMSNQIRFFSRSFVLQQTDIVKHYKTAQYIVLALTDTLRFFSL